MTEREYRPSGLPPRWVYRSLWALHRALHRVSGGRLGLRAGASDRLGTLRLHTVGHSSGQPRSTMLYYLEDGEDLAVVASNAGAASDPAWWRNLQKSPATTVDLPDGTRAVVAREATPDERGRLWPRLVAANADYERYARSAGRDIPVVVLQPDRPRADA